MITGFMPVGPAGTGPTPPPPPPPPPPPLSERECPEGWTRPSPAMPCEPMRQDVPTPGGFGNVFGTAMTFGAGGVAAPSLMGPRYPVVNLRRMGGLLEDYERSNLEFKEKLDKINREARAREEAARAGQPVYVPPTIPPNLPDTPMTPCPPGQTRSQSPPFACLQDVTTPNPYTFAPGTRPVKPGFTPTGPTVPVGVATGGGTPGPWRGEPLPPTFEVPERALQPCEPGYSRSPSPPYPCLKDVTSGDPERNVVPPTIPIQQTTGMAPGGAMVPTQYSWNTAPNVLRPYEDQEGVASVDCGPNRFWDGRQCRDSVGSMPSIPGGAAASLDPSTLTAPMTAATSFLGQVPLRAHPSLLGAPRLIRPVRLSAYRG